ncbi:MAG: SDR family oxidoreductase [Myxococcota bacterium]
MSLYSALKSNGSNGFGYGSTAEQVVDGVDLAGKVVAITGVTSGLGAETARVLAARGARIIGLARTEAGATEALRALPQDPSSPAIAVACELSEPGSVRAAVSALRAGPPLDAIVCNAGIMALPKLELKHGYELQFFTNHVGHFILVTGLLDRLAPAGRVVMLSSAAHTMAPRDVGIQLDNLDGAKGYDAWRNYGQSKLANLLFARELARRLPRGQTANAVHPGVITTNLGRHMPAWMRATMAVGRPLFMKTIPQGAATQSYVAANPGAAAITGEYWADCNVATSSTHGRDLDLARKLWDATVSIVTNLG